jgi:ferritin-like metal-binding protein YciE
MSASDKVINDIYRKIERERSLIQGAKAMSQNTNNQDVKTRCESNIAESKKNIAYLEKMLQDLQLKRRSVISPHAGYV